MPDMSPWRRQRLSRGPARVADPRALTRGHPDRVRDWRDGLTKNGRPAASRAPPPASGGKLTHLMGVGKKRLSCRRAASAELIVAFRQIGRFLIR